MIANFKNLIFPIICESLSHSLEEFCTDNEKSIKIYVIESQIIMIMIVNYTTRFLCHGL